MRSLKQMHASHAALAGSFAAHAALLLCLSAECPAPPAPREVFQVSFVTEPPPKPAHLPPPDAEPEPPAPPVPTHRARPQPAPAPAPPPPQPTLPPRPASDLPAPDESHASELAGAALIGDANDGWAALPGNGSSGDGWIHAALRARLPVPRPTPKVSHPPSVEPLASLCR